MGRPWPATKMALLCLTDCVRSAYPQPSIDERPKPLACFSVAAILFITGCSPFRSLEGASNWVCVEKGRATMSTILRAFAFAVSLLEIGLQGAAQAQTWPDRPIRFITSQAAGGGTDIICRIIAEQLSRAVGQQVVVENRPGGGNVIGTQAAARSAPNGYTFFFA